MMGARLGRYVLLKHLASGGMADVMIARAEGGIDGFERHVVIKRIRPEFSHDNRFISMFLDEARVAATLHHQHIVQVHDVGESNGEYFIAMEYVHGEDTRRVLSLASKQRGHVPLGHALAIVSAAAAGLHHAHERTGTDGQPLRIVHRDVSPSNILIGYDGSIKLVDFGIATATMRPETRGGGVKGKLTYMSPEQCRGVPVDRRSDVYALGVVLYELATTTRMLKGDSDYLVMDQIVHGHIAPPQSRRSDLPDELCDIIMRALATDREQRYASADELRIAVEQFGWSSGLTASASSIAAYMRLQFGQKREPWLDPGPGGPGGLEALTPADELASQMWSDHPREDLRFGGATPRPGPAGAPSALGRKHPRPTTSPDSKLSWERKSRTAGVRGMSARTVALIGAVPLAAAVIVLAVLRTRGSEGVNHGVDDRVDELAVREPEAARPAGSAVVAAPGAEAAQSAPPLPTTNAASGPDSVVDGAGSVTGAPARDARSDADDARDDAKPGQRTRSRTSSKNVDAGSQRARPERPARVAIAGPDTPARPEAGSADGETRPAIPLPSSAAPQNALPPAPAPAPISAAGSATIPEPPATLTAPPAAPVAAQPVVPAPPEKAAPPAPVTPQLITPAALDAHRTAGDRNIIPDAATIDAINRAGAEKLVSSYKVCVSVDGAISAVVQMRSTGFAAYDEKIRTTIRKDWRYRPFIVNGVPTPVCTALTFVYAQK